jgi:hypothetical protein
MYSLIDGKLDRFIWVGSDRYGPISKGICTNSGCHGLKLINPELVSNKVRLDATLTYYVSFKLMVLPFMKVGRRRLPVKE